MQREDGQEVALSLWSPEQALRSVDTATIRYSRGFLRCRPERWFPGFAMQWLPLAHSLGVEFKLVEARPVVESPSGFEFGYVGTVDAEPLGIGFSRETADVLLNAVASGAKMAARSIALEYLARRLLASLAISWSGPESSLVQFDPEGDLSNLGGSAAVKLVAGVNGTPITVWILLGQSMVDKLDGLWRRQLHSTAKAAVEVEAHLELTHLTVPPSMLSEYLRPGTTVDLDIPVSDAVLLVLGGVPWMSAKLRRLGEDFALETLAGPLPAFAIPSGTTRLGVELGTVQWSGAMAREMAQPGAVCDTEIKLQDRVSMVVNGEEVAQALLRSYQGRFVVSVL